MRQDKLELNTKIINKSSFKTELIEKLVLELNKDLNVDYEPKEIEIKNGRSLYSGYYSPKKRKISLAINPNNNQYPFKTEYNRKTKNLNYYNGYLDYLLLDSTEALIHILAHELRHNWQKYNRRNRSKWIHNSYGKFSNKDADSYAIRKVRQFRKVKNIYGKYNNYHYGI